MCREARDGACVGYAEEVRSAQTAGTCTVGAETGQCAPDHCDVQIGDSVYCSQCSNGGSDASSPAPTNGVCSADNAVCSAKSNGVYTTCAHESFMFQGGCYRADQTPGQAMCKTAQEGKCTSPQTGYFIPPEAQNTDQSIMACNDTAEITLTNKKRYVGVANCKTCDVPSQASGDTAEAATCTACEDGYFVNNNACEVCQDDNCATCAAEGTGKCSKCKVINIAGAKLYLKTESSSPTGTCVEASQCGSTAFPKDDAENGNKCISCSSVSDGGIENCGECSLLTPASRSSTVLVTCTKCGSDKYLKADGSGCVDDASGCTPSTEFAKKDSEKGNRCVPCGDATNGISNCAKCNPPTSTGGKPTCSECGSGYTLEEGKCVPPNTNKSALSTGAIAGISVAVIVVVGGLVGFLCWWFVCRGKA